jgi:peptidoglycan/LPS O-acetylase OafA/YrhL
MATSRSTAVDALRGAAALGVFLFHAWLYTLPQPRAGDRDAPGDFVLHELRLGLVLFFVLSGFLLFGPWVAASLGDGRLPRLGHYLRRRAGRILPAYYVALLGSIALLWPLDGSPGVRLPPAEGLPLFALFAQNMSGSTVMKLDPPMWTLAVEVCFYLVLPLLGWLALRAGRTRRMQAVVPVALIVLGTVYNLWLAIERPGLPFAKSLPAMLPYFGCGMLAAVLIHGRRPGRRGRLALAGGGLALVLADASWHALSDAAGASTDLAVVLRDLPAGIGFGMLLLAAAGADLRERAAGARASLPVRALAGLGIVSYGFYLWHVPVLLWLRAHGLLPLDPLGASVAGGAASLALATISWRAIERPAIEWARRTRDVRHGTTAGRQPA